MIVDKTLYFYPDFMLKHNDIFSAQSAKILLINYWDVMFPPCTHYKQAGVQAFSLATGLIRMATAWNFHSNSTVREALCCNTSWQPLGVSAQMWIL